ncbi:hypothetical protein [Poseidonocella sp. HB161398]|uniref:hypothetical protein n=1 Tax=Poseidonocella sp. HB161398 TaxID=2320855 RepID=UPI0011087DB6|nr:hypothetical protein [Poseidonocella sp. HB161398]
MAIRLGNAAEARQAPVVCMDARHAGGMPESRAEDAPVLEAVRRRTDRPAPRGQVQILRTGSFKAAQIMGCGANLGRAMPTACEALAGLRARLESGRRDLLKTSGAMFGKQVGSFSRAEEIIPGDLAVAPEPVPII